MFTVDAFTLLALLLFSYCRSVAMYKWIYLYATDTASLDNDDKMSRKRKI